MKLRAYRSIFVAIVAIAAYGCTPAEESADDSLLESGATPEPAHRWFEHVPDIVAFVGTQEIGREAFLRAVELEGMRRVARSVTMAEAMGRNEPPQEISSEQRKLLLDGMVDQLLIQIVAASEGIEALEEDIERRLESGLDALGNTGTYEEFLAYYKYTEESLRAELTEQEMREKLLSSFKDACVAGDEEVSAEFNRLMEEGKLNAPATADFWHIVVFAESPAAEAWKAAEDKIIEARSRIEAGEEFEAVALDVSEERTLRATNGLSQRVMKSQVPEPLQAAIFESEMDQLSAPIKTDYGWHLLKPASRNEGGPLTLEKASDPIQAQLALRCQAETLRARMDAARAKHPVSILYSAAGN